MNDDSATNNDKKKGAQKLPDDIQGSIGMSLADVLMAIGRECAPLFKEPWRSIDHGDLLYGEDGLPR